MMKVLHAISGLRQTAGGTVTALVGLGAAQRALGMDVAVAATFVQPENDDAATVRATGIDVHQLGPCRDPRSRHPRMREWISNLAQEHDVVHIHGLWEEIQHHAARACQQVQLPYVISPHGMLDPWSLAQGALKKKLYLALRLRRNLNRAAAVHFTTAIERELVRPLGLVAPSIVEPIGIDFSEFDPPPAKGLFRARFPQLGNRPIVIFLGRLHRKKGLDLLIPAFAQASRGDAMLVIAGPDDDFRHEVERLVASAQIKDRVLLAGMLRGRERIEALVDSDLFALPSYQENFGIAVVESLAAGVPVIISDQVNIHREIAESGGGAVVPTRIEPLVAELARWLGDAELRRKSGERGRAFVRERYDWSRIARNWAGHYASLSRKEIRA
jgi:glycosyltransferase involved in cell wall biosynthesis